MKCRKREKLKIFFTNSRMQNLTYIKQDTNMTPIPLSHTHSEFRQKKLDELIIFIIYMAIGRVF